MQEKEFDLLHEPWIKVLTQDLSVKEVSLIDALSNAHTYKALAGEMPTQDFAVLRLLLACMQTIFYRYNADGGAEEIVDDGFWDADDVMERWEDYWEKGKFSESVIRNYLEEYSERFWLFHLETPFFQVADLAYGTDYGVQSLYGNLKSSNNKATKYHFSMNDGTELQSMSYSEAARWLLHLNGFGVNVKADKKAPGTTNAAGTGRLGKLGLVYVDGDNLFQLIMLNLTPLAPNDDVWGAPSPIWENPVRAEQSIEIAPPNNLPELYTLQSRRILLKRKDNQVCGFKAMNGDYYSYENDFNEPMTIWRRTEDKKSHEVTYLPRKHSSEVQVWREFQTIFNVNNSSHVPGVVQWINMVCECDSGMQNTFVTFRTAGILYGDAMSYTFGDCLSDGITLSAELLKSLNREWMTLISDEIDKCGKVVDAAIKPFAKKIGMVINNDSAKPSAEQMGTKLIRYLTASYYAEIDQPFRSWVSSIRPVSTVRESKIKAWQAVSYRCIVKVINEYMASLNQSTFKIREAGDRVTSVPEAYNRCLYNLRIIYPNQHERSRE